MGDFTGMIGGPYGAIEKDFRIEVVRKAIHLCSLSIPVFLWNVPRTTSLAVFLPLTVAFLAVDLARYYHPKIETLFAALFGWLLRRHENDRKRKTLNGATYVLISACLCTLFFPKLVAVTCFSILIISDITSALVGRRFGRHRFLGKSLEGSMAFFGSALIVVALTPKASSFPQEYLLGAVSAALGTILEASPLPVDDNLSVPIGVGFALWGLYAIFLPGVNLGGWA